MKFVIDSDIPFIKGILEPYGETIYKKGVSIEPEDISDADVLVVRTRTKCTAKLLEKSSVKLIVTATIGTDHIDLSYCSARGIEVRSAAGCNANGVVQYVLTSLFVLAARDGKEIYGSTLGIVGAGNVGERLARMATLFGFKVMRCDPPIELKLREDSTSFRDDQLRCDLTTDDYYSIDQLVEESDIITFHTPLLESTKGMINRQLLERCKSGITLINSSRGEVLDESCPEMMNSVGHLIIDVWSGEPQINSTLLGRADIATPHIAGYSLEGKVNATIMSVNAIGDFFQIDALSGLKAEYPPLEERSYIYDKNIGYEANISRELISIFPIFELDRALRSDPSAFESQRANYVYRREISSALIEFAKNNT